MSSDLEALLAFQMKAAKVPEPHTQFVFHPTRRFRFDFCWPDRMLAAEVDGATYTGGRHARGAGIHSDCLKYSMAAAMGWRIIRVDAEMVHNGSALKYIEEALKWDSNGRS